MQKILLLLLCCPSFVIAQNVSSDYQNFRKNIISDYREYRKTVIEDYAYYLNGIWQEFKYFKAEKRIDNPKPVDIPTIESRPLSLDPPVEQVPEIDKEPIRPDANPDIKPQITPNIKDIVNSTLFPFYGMQLEVAKTKIISLASINNIEIASVWNEYQNQKLENVFNSLKKISSELGLNDWFQVELVRSYVDYLFFEAKPEDRILFQHFILAKWGYDIRIAKIKNELSLLIPFQQQVYERPYTNIDGRNYYIFYDNINQSVEGDVSIYTCELPIELDKGKSINLVLNELEFNITDGKMINNVYKNEDICINTSINGTLMEMLRHYPQMDISHYAESIILRSFRRNLLQQVKAQIADKSENDAVSIILNFVQKVFNYSTDENQHGYEKPYFIEENFYYPQNDCEDRAILFAYLVHNLLDLDVHLIQYPGHICTGVHLDDNSIIGDRYTYGDKKYYICDPTFVGAKIGQCMPDFRNVKPQLKLWY